MIELKQYKSCNSCKAYFDGHCSLSYPIEPNKYIEQTIVSFKPAIKCPKPKTINDYIEASNFYINKS